MALKCRNNINNDMFYIIVLTSLKLKNKHIQTVPMLPSSLNRAGSLERMEQSQDERAEV